jgi:adenylate cyclase
MAEERVQRRLAAILAADVVGYSRLIEADEEGTRARLRKIQTELINPRIAADGGRIVKTTGDGILAEFPSAVDAVRSALSVQSAMSDQNDSVPEDQKLVFRVGINVGDVIIEDDDIHGDGVNVAARLEGLSQPGEVYISGTVYDQVGGKISASFEDLGEHTVKNMTTPVRVYRIEVGRAEQAAAPAPLGPSAIAVLPFENLSGDAEQEFFADGLTEDIITALSGSHAFPVIARNSTFAYKGKSPDLRQVARELGVRYVIEGSVRKGGNRIRISAQLIDGDTGQHIWAQTYDRDLADIFDVQDEITGHIAATIEPTLERVEGKRLAAQRGTNIDAWGYYQQATLRLHEYTAEGNRQARELALKAIEIDPDYALAYVPLAYSYYRDLRTGNAEDETQAEEELFRVARKAIELDNTSAESHYAMGLAYQVVGQYDLSRAELSRSLELNPYDTWVRFAFGGTLAFSGNPEESVVQLEKAFQLNPNDSRLYVMVTLLARAHLNAGNYQDAVTWAQRAITYRADSLQAHLYMASALGHLGRTEDARAQLEECERIRPGSTKASIIGARDTFVWETRRVANIYGATDPMRNAHFLDGLRKAGAPE